MEAKTATKKKALAGKKKTLGGKKKVGKKPKKVKPVIKVYAKDPKENENEVFYEGQIGQGYTVQLSKWLKNGNSYVSLRKPGTAGVTLSTAYFKNLVQALTDIEEQFGEHIEQAEK